MGTVELGRFISSSSQNFSNFVQNGTQDFFCTSQPMGRLIWPFYSVFFFLLGLPPSVMILRELCKRQTISNDFFVFNLTVIDIVYLVVLPLGIINFMIWKNNKLEWISNFTYSLILSGRPLFMACVCGDYYFAVVHPIIYMNKNRMTVIRKKIALTIYLCMCCFGCLIASNHELNSTILGSSPLLIALPVIGFCDISVFRALGKKDPSGKNTVHPQKKRAMRTIITSLVMAFIVYLPPAVIFSMGQNTHLTYAIYNCIFVFVAVFFTSSGCVIMPVLYLESIGQLNMGKIAQKIKCRK